MAARGERTVLVAAQVDADGGKVRHAPRQVGAEALALEVVAPVLVRDEQGERVLEVLDLLQVRVVGPADHPDAQHETGGRQQRLLDLHAVEHAPAPGGVVQACAEPWVHGLRLLRLEPQAVAQQVHAVVVERQAEVRGAPGVSVAPGLRRREQGIPDRRTQPVALAVAAQRERALFEDGFGSGAVAVAAERAEIHAVRRGALAAGWRRDEQGEEQDDGPAIHAMPPGRAGNGRRAQSEGNAHTSATVRTRARARAGRGVARPRRAPPRRTVAHAPQCCGRDALIAGRCRTCASSGAGSCGRCPARRRPA